MAKIDKDQFEEFLKDNISNEGPSHEVFMNLQREASWNQPGAGVSSDNAVLKTVLLIALMAMFVYMLSGDKQLNNAASRGEKQYVPAEEVIETKPVNVIARRGADYETGVFKLLKFKNDDFNLSFAEDKDNQTVLGFARELNNT